MKVLIEIRRKDSMIEHYSCVTYKVRDSNYLYLYNTQATVAPTSLQEIVPIHDKDIIEINFKYEG